jgi:hypothetical protein
MLSASVNHKKYKATKLEFYPITQREQGYVIPIMYAYKPTAVQPLYLEGPLMHSTEGVQQKVYGPVIHAYVGYRSVLAFERTIKDIYARAVRSVWDSTRDIRELKRLPSIDCIYSLLPPPLYMLKEGGLRNRYLPIKPSTVFRLPVTDESGDYITVTGTELVNLHLSFIPIFKMSDITVRTDGNANSITLRMDLEECVVTHMSKHLVRQIKTLHSLNQNKKLVETVQKQLVFLRVQRVS